MINTEDRLTTMLCGCCLTTWHHVGRIPIGTCPNCGGLIGEGVTGVEIAAWVDLTKWSEKESMDGARYFDFIRLDGSRVHGWFDPETKQVLQIG